MRKGQRQDKKLVELFDRAADELSAVAEEVVGLRNRFDRRIKGSPRRVRFFEEHRLRANAAAAADLSARLLGVSIKLREINPSWAAPRAVADRRRVENRSPLYARAISKKRAAKANVDGPS